MSLFFFFWGGGLLCACECVFSSFFLGGGENVVDELQTESPVAKVPGRPRWSCRCP